MTRQRSRTGRYVFAALLGAIGGGVLVAIATDAIPRLVSGMAESMGQLMGKMSESGIELPEQ